MWDSEKSCYLEKQLLTLPSGQLTVGELRLEKCSFQQRNALFSLSNRFHVSVVSSEILWKKIEGEKHQNTHPGLQTARVVHVKQLLCVGCSVSVPDVVDVNNYDDDDVSPGGNQGG